MTTTRDSVTPTNLTELVLAVSIENPTANITLAGSVIEIDARSLTRLNLPAGPWSPLDTVKVTHAGDGPGQFLHISGEDSQLSHLILPGCSIPYLSLTGLHNLRSLRVRGTGTPVALDATSTTGIEELDLEDVQLNLIGDLSSLRSVRAARAHLIGSGYINATTVTVSGQVHLGVHGVTARVLEIKGSAASVDFGRGESVFRTLQFSEKGRLDLDGGVIRADFVPQGASLRLIRGARLTLTQTDPLGSLSLHGSGSVHVVGTLQHPAFDSTGQLVVVLAEGARLVDGSGMIALDARAGSTCMGSMGKTPLGLSRLIHAEDAVLDNVNIFALEEPSDAVKLIGARRFVPWSPAGLKTAVAQRRQVRKRATELGDAQRAWRENVDTLKIIQQCAANKGVPAGIQSTLRVAICRARRESLTWRQGPRERVFLSLYALVGYGERIGLPLIWWLALTAGAASYGTNLDSGPDRTSFFVELGRLTSLPMEFFRLTGMHETMPGTLGRVVSIALEVLGIAMIGLAIMAFRRQLRPDEKPSKSE